MFSHCCRVHSHAGCNTAFPSLALSFARKRTVYTAPQRDYLRRHFPTSNRLPVPKRFSIHPTTRELLARSSVSVGWVTTLHVHRAHYIALPVPLARSFHSSQPARAAPLLWLVGLLKSSAALNMVATLGRFTLSLLPWAWLRERIATRALQLADRHPELVSHPRWATIISQNTKWLGFLRGSVWVLALTPIALIAITCIASAERAPISGRWRMIMLSPEEEELIHKDLKGYGWYTTVIKQMSDSSNGNVPKILNPTDWRWKWVEATLRRLEAGIAIIPASANAPPSAAAEQFYSQAHDGPIPPPSKYPLLARPRISQLVHALPPSVENSDTESHHSNDPEHHTHHLAPHAQLGPPYNILIVEKPECNAFSHGYGPAGAGGIVVYTGFLEEILSHNAESLKPNPITAPPDSGIWSSLMSIFTPPPTPRSLSPAIQSPTTEQTEELAVVLAHELAHLILCHHLESLSSSLIVTPTLFAMLGDVGRTILFPITMFFGPFLNDAIAKMFQVGHAELQKTQLECTTKVLEVEADAISARLLAYAGYDARSAVQFWESRRGSDDLSCSSNKTSGRHGFEGKDHPLSEERLIELKAELTRWERWQRAVAS